MTETRKIEINDLEFTCRVAGQEQDDLVIFLHGFPETSIMWKELMREVASLGFYCLAPDMRGYSPGACPRGIKNYTIDKLRDDILGIADTVKKYKFHLVAHDWGAAIGWNVVYNSPDRIRSWTALSVPHNRAFGKALRTDKEQKKKSRYILFFLIPILPEILIRANDFKRFRSLWSGCSNEEVSDYLQVFRRKPSLTAALNYYRANIGKGKNQPIGEITKPTLFIWGKHDLAIGKAAAEYNASYIKGDYNFLPVEGGHWLLQSNFAHVEKAVTDHILKYGRVED